MAVENKANLILGYTLQLGSFTAINPWHCATTITYTSSIMAPFCSSGCVGRLFSHSNEDTLLSELTWCATEAFQYHLYSTYKGL